MYERVNARWACINYGSAPHKIFLLLLLLLLLVSFVYLTGARSGVLRTQKLKSSLLRTQS